MRKVKGKTCLKHMSPEATGQREVWEVCFHGDELGEADSGQRTQTLGLKSKVLGSSPSSPMYY